MDIEKLEKLNELKEKGILTPEEFEAQKNALLHSNDSQNVSKGESKKESENGQDLSMWKYFVSCVTDKYLCFKGRARRKEYWGFVLCEYFIDFVLGLFFGLFSQLNTDIAMFFLILRVVVCLALLLPSIGVLVRRFHDVNLSGWWILTIVALIVVVFLKSDMKENKYGKIPAGVVK